MTPTFSVKNFERFQHYKDRSPPWIKLYNELLDDYEFACLQDASKMHLIAIWLLASRSDNKLPYDPAWIGKRINATEPVNLDALAAAGFIVVSQALQGAEQVASKPLAKRLPRDRGETEGETEQRRGETEAEESAVAPRADKDWAFKGEVIRVEERNMKELLVLYPLMSRGDILRDLKECDAYYSDDPPKKQWWAAKKWLERTHNKLLQAKKQARAAEDAAYRGVI
jgi:hypothetical protein